MPIWLMALPSIIEALIAIARFLIEQRSKKEIKACSVSLKEAAKSGKTGPLMELIERLKSGKDC
jgi:hypothetical protein